MVKCYVSTSATVTKLLIDLAEDNGWTVCSTFKEEAPKTNPDGSLVWPIFTVRDDVWGRHLVIDGEKVSLDEMVQHLESKKQISELVLNNQYTAKINKRDKEVTVGCQTFSFDILRKLVAKFD